MIKIDEKQQTVSVILSINDVRDVIKKFPNTKPFNELSDQECFDIIKEVASNLESPQTSPLGIDSTIAEIPIVRIIRNLILGKYSEHKKIKDDYLFKGNAYTNEKREYIKHQKVGRIVKK